jgi:hypothetical protein
MGNKAALDIVHGTDTNCVLNISIKNKAFLWMQQKTGTTLAHTLLKNYGFKSYLIYDGIVDFTKDYDIHAHTACFFSNHLSYTFIATVRNPYTALFSEYAPNPYATMDGFREYLENKFYGPRQDKFFQKWERMPDYRIRIESVYEDYLKIPFIKDSEFNRSGELKKLIDSVPNKNRFGYDIKKFFNKSIADMIYYNTSRYFEMFDYDRNSWK